MPLYCGHGNLRKPVNYLYVGQSNLTRNMLSFWCGASNSIRLIMGPVDMLDGIVIQLENVTVTNYPNATETSKGTAGTVEHQGSGYSSYVDLDISQTVNNTRFTIQNHPLNEKQEVYASFYMYAKLKDGQLVPITVYSSGLNNIITDTGKVGKGYFSYGRYSGRDEWWVWYTQYIFQQDFLENYQTIDNIPVPLTTSKTWSEIESKCLRAYGNGYTSLYLENFSINGTVYPITFVNLLTP